MVEKGTEKVKGLFTERADETRLRRLEEQVAKLVRDREKVPLIDGVHYLPEITGAVPATLPNALALYGFAGSRAARIATTDENGLVLHAFMCITGERGFIVGAANITLALGTKNATGTVTHNQNWSSAGQVYLTIQDISVLTGGEQPVSVHVYNIGANAFSWQIVTVANVAAQRVVSVGYLCTGII